jgi:tRNA(fMet)-specific endonuclease VapC
VKVLLDTNVYTLFKSKTPQEALNVINFADEIGLPNVVIAELYAGFHGGTRFAENVAGLEEFLTLPQTQIVRFSDSTPHIFGEQQALLRRQGVSVPHNDLWIAALAIENDFVVYSLDKHFAMIPNITVIQSFAEFLRLP